MKMAELIAQADKIHDCDIVGTPVTLTNLINNLSSEAFDLYLHLSPNYQVSFLEDLLEVAMSDGFNIVEELTCMTRLDVLSILASKESEN